MPLSQDRIVAIVPQGHDWGSRREVSLAELVAGPLVLREPGSRTRAVFERALGDADLFPGETLEIGSREAVREAVAAGLGTGIIAESELGTDPRLVSLAIAAPGLEVVEYAACMAERRSVRVVDAFFGLLADAPDPGRKAGSA